MDDVRFDALARSLSAGRSRRGLMRIVAAASLGTLVSARTARDAAAACRLAGQSCSAAKRCCDGAKCAANGHCKCKVSQNFFACDGPGTRCVNVATSAKHCGGCGNPSCDPEQNEIWRNGGCVDACADELHDGLETDVDCGGPVCDPCAKGKTCDKSDDCEGDLICDSDDTCQDPHTCGDGIKNGRETDVDCGGPNCSRCGDGLKCFVNDDCKNRFCDRSADPNEAGVCGTNPSCRNGKKDGTETDVDCGGPDCPGCEFGHKCNSLDDCASGLHFCRDRAGDGTAKQVCLECANGAISADDTCLLIVSRDRPFCVRNKCRQCRNEGDCKDGEECDDGTCKAAGTCGVGQNACLDGNDGCNGNSTCICFQTTSQESFCSSRIGLTCFACAADSDCDTVTGEGSACGDWSGCTTCSNTNHRVCMAPCATSA